MTIAAIALLATLSGSPAHQADTPRVETRSEVRVITMGGPEGQGPGLIDADEDGVVTREEFSAPMATAFDRMDADHDGRLTANELAAGHGEGGPGAPGPHVMMMLGGPGGPEGGPMMFRGGGDGNARVFTFRYGGPEGGPGERRVEIRRFGGPDGQGDMDKDGDGRVSEAEFLAPMREAFQAMDADGDGALEAAERPAGPPSPGE